MSRVSGCKMTKPEKKVSSVLMMMKLSGFMKTKTPLQFDVCSEGSSAHVDCQDIKEKATANHVAVVFTDHIRTKANQKEKVNLEEHIKQRQRLKKPIIKKEKARKERAKDPKEARVCLVRKDTCLQKSLHLHKKEKVNRT